MFLFFSLFFRFFVASSSSKRFFTFFRKTRGNEFGRLHGFKIEFPLWYVKTQKHVLRLHFFLRADFTWKCKTPTSLSYDVSHQNWKNFDACFCGGSHSWPKIPRLTTTDLYLHLTLLLSYLLLVELCLKKNFTWNSLLVLLSVSLLDGPKWKREECKELFFGEKR